MITEGLKCVRCEHDLEVEEVLDFDNECGKTTILFCPYCGARYEETEPLEEDKMNYDFYKNGCDTSGRLDEADIMNGHCLNCGSKVSIANNFMLSDYDDTITEPDDKMNFVLNECPNCGMQEVRWDNSDNERKIFPYWTEHQDDEQNENEDETKE